MTRRASLGKRFRGAALIAMVSLVPAATQAQQEQAQQEAAQQEAAQQEEAQRKENEDLPTSVTMDEIIVIGNKDGDPVDAATRYEQQLLERIVAAYAREQILKDEERARALLPAAVESNDGRIRWGYDAQAEARMRRELALTELPVDERKPATVIRFRF